MFTFSMLLTENYLCNIVSIAVFYKALISFRKNSLVPITYLVFLKKSIFKVWYYIFCIKWPLFYTHIVRSI